MLKIIIITVKIFARPADWIFAFNMPKIWRKTNQLFANKRLFFDDAYLHIVSHNFIYVVCLCLTLNFLTLRESWLCTILFSGNLFYNVLSIYVFQWLHFCVLFLLQILQFCCKGVLYYGVAIVYIQYQVNFSIYVSLILHYIKLNLHRIVFFANNILYTYLQLKDNWIF